MSTKLPPNLYPIDLEVSASTCAYPEGTIVSSGDGFSIRGVSQGQSSKTQKIRCSYCNRFNLEHKTVCDGCGGPLGEVKNEDF